MLLLFKPVRLVAHAEESQTTPVVMAALQALVVCTPEVADSGRPIFDENRHTMPLLASLWEEFFVLRQHVNSQEYSASHEDDDKAEDEVKHLAVRRCLHSFQCFIMDMLPDYVPQPDPSGHAPCLIALTSLDGSFEEEHHTCTIDRASGRFP